jgi:uncharacterized protein
MTGLDPAIGVSLGAAFIAGAAGSGHCLAMCGGLAGAFALRRSSAPTSSRMSQAIAYNLARVSSYAAAGAIAGALGHALLRAVDVATMSVALRVLAGAIMAAAAGRLLFGWRLLDPLEAAGAGLWRRIAPRAGRSGHRGGLGGAIGLGLAWGCLPCGLTYSMLLLAATTASVATGALVMAAFGAGTLPAMVGATLAFERAARVLATRASLRTIAGVLLFGFGAWTAGSAIRHGLEHGAHAAHATPASTPASPDGAPAAHEHRH